VTSAERDAVKRDLEQRTLDRDQFEAIAQSTETALADLTSTYTKFKEESDAKIQSLTVK